MSVYIDANVFVAWERGKFDLPEWAESRPDEAMAFPATVWQELLFGRYAWETARADKRSRSLGVFSQIASVAAFGKAHAEKPPNWPPS